MAELTALEKFKRDIKTLTDSISVDVADLATKPMTREEEEGVRQHLKWCQDEVRDQIRKFDKAKALASKD